MMEFIGGFCTTNLDDFNRVKWPTRFVAVPRIGERVEGYVDGRRDASLLRSLRVVGVTHLNGVEGPCIRVELHR